jgi:hypothetical protein
MTIDTTPPLAGVSLDFPKPPDSSSSDEDATPALAPSIAGLPPRREPPPQNPARKPDHVAPGFSEWKNVLANSLGTDSYSAQRSPYVPYYTRKGDRFMNKALRATDDGRPYVASESEAQALELARRLDDELRRRQEKAIAVNGIVHRGILGQQYLDGVPGQPPRFEENRVFKDGAFLSTTGTPSIADKYSSSRPSDRQIGTWITIRSQTGVPIHHESRFPDEAEVLLRPNTPLMTDLHAFDPKNNRRRIAQSELPTRDAAPAPTLPHELPLGLGDLAEGSAADKVDCVFDTLLASREPTNPRLQNQLSVILAFLAPDDVKAILTQPRYMADAREARALYRELEQSVMPLERQIAAAIAKHYRTWPMPLEAMERARLALGRKAWPNPALCERIRREELIPVRKAHPMAYDALAKGVGKTGIPAANLAAQTLLSAAFEPIRDAGLKKDLWHYFRSELPFLGRLRSAPADSKSVFDFEFDWHRLVPTLDHFIATHATNDAWREPLAGRGGLRERLVRFVHDATHPSAECGNAPSVEGITDIVRSMKLRRRDNANYKDLAETLNHLLRHQHGPTAARRFMQILARHPGALDRRLLHGDMCSSHVLAKLGLVMRQARGLSADELELTAARLGEATPLAGDDVAKAAFAQAAEALRAQAAEQRQRPVARAAASMWPALPRDAIDRMTELLVEPAILGEPGSDRPLRAAVRDSRRRTISSPAREPAGLDLLDGPRPSAAPSGVEETAATNDPTA